MSFQIELFSQLRKANYLNAFYITKQECLNIQQQLEKLKKKVDKKKKSKEKLKGIIEEMKKKNDEQGKQINQLETQILVQKKELEQKQEENKNLQVKNKELDQQLQEKNKKIVQNKLDAKTNENKISNLEELLKQKQIENNNLQQKMNTLEAQLKEAQNKNYNENQLIQVIKENQEKAEKIYKGQEEFYNFYRIHDTFEKFQLKNQIEKIKEKQYKIKTEKIVQQQLNNFELGIRRSDSGIYQPSHRILSRSYAINDFCYEIEILNDQNIQPFKLEAYSKEYLKNFLVRVFEKNSDINQNQVKKVQNIRDNIIYERSQWNVQLIDIFDNSFRQRLRLLND